MTDLVPGIDLGTSFSSVCFPWHGGLRYLNDPDATHSTYSIPSSACVVEVEDTIVFGSRAESWRRAAPECYQREFKRELGSPVDYHMGSRSIAPEQLTALFLRFLVEAAGTSTGRTPTGGVVTVPVAYDGTRRELVLDAARRCGLAEVSLVDEPVAAVVGATAAGEIPADGTTLVYDLGGGTFDTALVRTSGADHVVLASGGLPTFGGIDMDKQLERDFIAKTPDLLPVLAERESDDPQVRARARRIETDARDMCREVKHRLSHERSTTGDLNYTFEYPLTRPDLESMVRPDLEATLVACRDALAAAGLSEDDLDQVLLVGGATRMPLVLELVRERLGRPVQRASDPELAVCQGAAILAQSPATPPRTSPPARPRRRRPTPAPQPDAEPSETEESSGPRDPRRSTDRREPSTAREVCLPLTLVAAAQPEHPGSTGGDVSREWARKMVPEVLRRHPNKSLFVDDIPVRKALNARRSTRLRPEEQILGLIDCTVFGGAKDAIVFGEDAVYEASFTLQGPGWRPVLRVPYPELLQPVSQRFDVTGSDVSARELNAIIDELRAEVRYATGSDQAQPPLLALSFGATGERLLTGAGNGRVRSWDADSLTPSARGLDLTAARAVNSVAGKRRGNRMAFGDDTGTVGLCDAASGRRLLSHRSGAAVWSVRFSPNDRYVAIGGNGGLVQVISASDASLQSELQLELDVTCVAFEHRGVVLATAGLDGVVRTCDWRSGSLISTVGYEHQIFALDLSPVGPLLAVGTAAGLVELWDLDRETSVGGFEIEGVVRSVRFDRTGDLLACASDEGIVEVWSVAERRKLFETSGLTDLWEVAWHPHGTRLATASADGPRVWSTAGEQKDFG